VSSRNRNSLHGLLARISPDARHGFHRSIVLENCRPGSPHSHAPSAIVRSSFRAGNVSATSPLVTSRVLQSESASTARRNSSGTRTLRLLFWYATLPYASPSSPAE